MNLVIFFVLVKISFLNADETDWCFHRVTKLRTDFTTQILIPTHKIGQRDSTLVQLEIERGTEIVGGIDDSGGHGEGLVVEHHRAEQAVLLVVHVEMQSANHFRHHIKRLHGHQLIVHIHTGAKDAQVGKTAYVAR